MLKIASLFGLGLVVFASANATPLGPIEPTIGPSVRIPMPVFTPRIATPAPTAPTQVSDGNPLPFPPGSAELAAAAYAALDKLAIRIVGGEDLVVEIRGFAAVPDDDPSKARRLSLARAINVRAALIADGVPKDRLIVRALGDRTAADRPPDRVDIVAMAR